MRRIVSTIVSTWLLWKLLTRNCHRIIIGTLIDQMQHRAFRSLRGQIWAPKFFLNLELHTDRRTNHAKSGRTCSGSNGQTCKCRVVWYKKHPENPYILLRSVESLSTPWFIFRTRPVEKKKCQNMSSIKSKDVRWGKPLNRCCRRSNSVKLQSMDAWLLLFVFFSSQGISPQSIPSWNRMDPKE